MPNLRRLTFAASLVFVSNASGLSIDYGTAEEVTFRNCIVGATACDDISPRIDFVNGGFPGAASSSASASLAGYGTASGSVSLSGVIGAPVLTASATSAAGTRQNTNSIALQRYTYTGATPTTRTFGGTLTYSQTLTGSYPLAVGIGVLAAIDVFTLSVSEIDVGSTADSNFDALFNPSALPGYGEIGSQNFEATTTTANGFAALAVTLTLQPGETFWVWTILQTPAVNGGFSDASHTLVTTWDNTAGLVPAVIAAVPEPTPLLLIATAALAGMTMSRRRIDIRQHG